MHFRGLSLRHGAFAAPVFVLVAVAASAPEAGQYEQAPSFSAGQALPPNLLRNPDYSVENSVGLDDYQYVYQVKTEWGTYRVEGTDLLRVRAREIAATKKLDEIDGASTLVNAAGRTALKPLGTARDLVTAPGKTIGDTFKGVGNLFGSVDASMAAKDPHKEGVVASLTGGATARRKLAYDYGVDPNTTFKPLHDELTRLATVNAIGETSANAGLAFVTGGAGIAISVGGTSAGLRKALRDKTASQLEKEGRQQLAAIGIPQATMDAFYANPHLSPTDKAIIVTELVGLGSVAGRELFVASAANAKSIEMGFFYRRQAELIGAFDEKISPVSAFVKPGGSAPMLQTGRGTVSVLPVDYLYWSPPLEGLISGVGKGEMWITGKASPMTTSKLAARGWNLVPQAGAKLGQ